MSDTPDRERDILIEQYKRALGIAIDALRFYADPETYHAIMIVPDRPAGLFADDFGPDNDFEYQRPMPGRCARDAIERLGAEYGDLEFMGGET